MTDKLTEANPLRRWRGAMSLTQAQAARALGLSKRTVETYEKGEVPRVVRLACYALRQKALELDTAPLWEALDLEDKDTLRGNLWTKTR